MAFWLVTGGAGFIGSHVVEGLIDKGERVRVLDNFATGKRENLLPWEDRVEIVEGDIRSYHTVIDALQGIDIVVHLGALPSVPRSVKDPITTNDVNVGGTLNVLDASRFCGVKKFVFASSSSVYGNGGGLPRREDMPCFPVSPYAISKLAGEQYALSFAQLYGMEVVSLRFFNVFGPRQDPTSQYSGVIAKFCRWVLEEKPVVIFGDGTQTRDFTYVKDVAEVVIRAGSASGVSREVVNVAQGKRVSVLHLVEVLEEITGRDIERHFAPPRKGDVMHSQADITKMKRLFDYEPRFSFEEGMRHTFEWYVKECN